MAKTELLVNECFGTTVVTFQQPSVLDGLTIEAIGGELYELVDRKAKRRIILDFTRVRAMSSAMIGVVISLNRKAASIGGKVVFCGLRDEVMKVFKIMKLDKVLQFAENEEAALKTLVPQI
jgi:anti-anti-sigma factor